MHVNRITYSQYTNLGWRLNYFHCALPIILTKHQDCGKVRSVVDNSYSLAVI